jgi:hypothetical protein
VGQPGGQQALRGRRPKVTIDPEVTRVRLDADGLPMQGLLSAVTGWHVERHDALADGAVLGARFDFAAHEALMAAFLFAHELRDASRASHPIRMIARGGGAA